MISQVKRLWDMVLDILFPPSCLACTAALTGTRSELPLVCDACTQSIKVSTAYFCPACRARIPVGQPGCHPKANYVLAGATSYEIPAVQSLIWRLKFNRRTLAAGPLADIVSLFLDSIRLDISQSIIVPIPLHPSRLRDRGFNQSELIARELIKTRGGGLCTDVLRKQVATQPQSKLDQWDKRERNVRGSFIIANPELVKGRDIILLDDVWTSGATMNEAARLLKAAGAKKIIALVVAKAG